MQKYPQKNLQVEAICKKHEFYWSRKFPKLGYYIQLKCVTKCTTWLMCAQISFNLPLNQNKSMNMSLCTFSLYVAFAVYAYNVIFNTILCIHIHLLYVRITIYVHNMYVFVYICTYVLHSSKPSVISKPFLFSAAAHLHG